MSDMSHDDPRDPFRDPAIVVDDHAATEESTLVVGRDASLTLGTDSLIVLGSDKISHRVVPD